MLTLLAALPVTSPAQAAPLDRAECTEMAGKMRAAMTALESGRESIVASDPTAIFDMLHGDALAAAKEVAISGDRVVEALNQYLRSMDKMVSALAACGRGEGYPTNQ
jgi:hypothetical protein